jgi:hypothetical protein
MLSSMALGLLAGIRAIDPDHKGVSLEIIAENYRGVTPNSILEIIAEIEADGLLSKVGELYFW